MVKLIGRLMTASVEDQQLRRTYLCGLSVIIAIGLAARILYLWTPALWLDEGYTILSAARPFGEIFRVGSCDANPILQDLLYGVFYRLAGGEVSYLKLVGVVSGVLSIWLIAQLGKLLFGERAGLFAGLLLGLSSYHVAYSQFVRIYSIAFLLTLFCLFSYVEHQRQTSAKSLVVFLLSTAFLVNAHAFGFFVLGSLFLFDLSHLSREKIFSFLGTWGLTTALTAPSLYSFFVRFEQSSNFSWIGAPSLKVFASIWYHVASENLPALIIIASLCFFALLKAWRSGEDRNTVCLLAIFAIIPVVGALAISYCSRSSIFHVRYFFIVVAPVYLLAARGFVGLPRGNMRMFIGCILVLALTSGLLRYFERQRTQVRSGIYENLAHDFAEGDVVVHANKCSLVPSLVYHQNRFPEFVLPEAKASPVLNCVLGAPNPKFTEADLTKYKRVWFVSIDCPPHERQLEIGKIPLFSNLNQQKSDSDNGVSLFLQNSLAP